MGVRERRKFDREFKVETARLIVERGRKISEVARDLDIHENVLRKWKNEYIEDTQHAFPGKGRLKPEEEEGTGSVLTGTLRIHDDEVTKFAAKRPRPMLALV